MTQQTFNLLIYIWIGLAILMLPFQLWITAPYGRHSNDRWGPRLSNKLGWMIMEIVSPIAFALGLIGGDFSNSNVVWFIFALWVLHYLHRSIVYPLRTQTMGKKIPLVIVLSAMLFNAFNGWSNGFYLSAPWSDYTDEWFHDPRFAAGLLIFLTGAVINIWADNRLIALRTSGNRDYTIPRGGLFSYVSCPNHLGEIIEWIGFAVLCWNLPAVSFSIWTATYLGARAWSHHIWYRKKFADYPKQRRAIIPYIL